MTALANSGSKNRVQLFGTSVDALTMEESLERVFTLVADPVPSQHVVLNASKVVQMEQDHRLRTIIASCDLVNADGMSVVWASRILGKPLPERVTGIDLFYEIMKRAADTGHRVYFLGATDEVLDLMMARLRRELPNLRIAGYRNGYWHGDEEESVVSGVRAATPDFLFLAMPSPTKEYWLNEHLGELDVPFVMGVGGSFDVLAGLVRRAPGWAQRAGCEWLYRLLQEPGRMWKRYLVGNSRFLLLTARQWLQQIPPRRTLGSE